MDHIAYLSSQNDYIIFNYKGKTVRFKGPYSLQKIVKVKEWDEGYIVVDVKYANKKVKRTYRRLYRSGSYPGKDFILMRLNF